MTNKEIIEYMDGWMRSVRDAPTNDRKIMVAMIAIPAMLAEIAMRLSERGFPGR